MKLFSSHHNIAVVGLNNSGKTTFITSFINHILNNDPSKLKLGKGDVHIAFDEELLPPCTGLERFPFQKFRRVNDNGKIKYIYSPINCENHSEWQENVMNDCVNINMHWISTIYWKLDTISCVLILRNKKWFDSILPKLELTWDVIQTEGQNNAYEHRMPIKRAKKRHFENANSESVGCLLSFLPA